MPFLGVQPSRGLVGTAGIDADAITSAKIADDQIDSEHYAAGSIDTAHIGNTQVTTAKIATNAIDGTLTKDALIADYSDVTITASDLIMYGDATDSNNTKRDTVQGILDLAGGGLVFLGSVTASNSATVDLESMIDNTKYDVHKVFISGVQPASGSTLRMRFSDDNGTSYESGGNYKHCNVFMDDSSSTVSGHVAAAETFVAMGDYRTIGADSDGNYGNEITLYHFKDTTKDPLVTFHGGFSHDAEDDLVIFTGSGAMASTGADIDAVRFYQSSGNIAVGEFRIYGIAKS